MTDASMAHFPPLAVGTDAEAVRKVYRLPLGMTRVFVILFAVAALAAAALMASLAGFWAGVFSSAPILVSTLFMADLAVRTAGVAAARAAAGTVLTLDATGLESPTPQGLIVLPWQAIASVELRRRGRHHTVTFHLVDGVTPTSPGVQTTIKPGVFRLLAKKGFRIGSVGIDVPVQTILDATAAFTAGRLIAR